MKFTSIFFKTNESILEATSKIQTSEKYEAICFNIFQNERKCLGDLPQRLQQMAEISADSLSELESYGQGKQYIHFFALMHAWFPFGHLLDNTQSLFVQ